MSQPVVILVGPDMCGKTQIAKELSHRTGIPYFKASSEHRTFLGDQDEFLHQLRYADPRLLDFMRQTGHGAIMDRGYPCEFAYSKFFARPTDREALARVDEGFASIGANLVICYRSSYEGVNDDLDNRLYGDHLHAIHDAYMEFFRWTKCRVKLLNVDDENLDREVNEIMTFIGRVS